MLRGAFIGFGNIAAKGHMPAWLAREDVEIVAASDVDAHQRAAFLSACPQARWYDGVDALLAAESLDFVDICTPPDCHGLMIRVAAKAGLDIVCEKPLTSRVEDAIDLKAVCNGRVVCCVHNWLKAPVIARITGLLEQGVIGTVRRVHWQTLRIQPAASAVADGTQNWRLDPEKAGGGILYDHGWHALYCVNRWFGGAPQRLVGSLESRGRQPCALDDTAAVALEFGGGGAARIFLTWTATERANHIEIEGDKGQVHSDGSCIVANTDFGTHHWQFEPGLHVGSHHPDWFVGVAEDFCTAVARRQPGNLDEAILCSQLISLAQRSSALGGIRLDVGAVDTAQHRGRD